MAAAAILLRRLAVRRLVLATIVAALLIPAIPADPVSAASFSVRLEAGVHRGYMFNTAGAVTARKTMTLVSPATVTASVRRSIPTHGVHLRVASGTLAGWWVHEDALAYVPGITGSVAYSPSRSVWLRAARYELYTFDNAGVMTAARGRRIGTATTIHVSRGAVIRGRPYIRIADGAWAGWWVPGTLTAPTAIACSAGSPPTGKTARTVRAVGTAIGEIALTFDMGGRVTPALEIMRFLEVERVCSTIFPTG